MKFNDFDSQMRIYEESLDQLIIPGLFFAARLDGRSFTRLTKEICAFEAPFDIQFRDLMVDTAKHLMNCGFRVVYGYTQSDEISLLFHQNEDAFSRKARKYVSILAGEASAAFSTGLGKVASFDCRLIPLANETLIRDYFLWRQEDAHRNALNAHCYWLLRKKGLSEAAATNRLSSRTSADKNELLFAHGINFNDLPNWQKRGVGVHYAVMEKQGYNPVSKKAETALRKKISVDYNLPRGTEYGDFVIAQISKE